MYQIMNNFFKNKNKHRSHLVDNSQLPLITTSAAIQLVMSFVFYFHPFINFFTDFRNNHYKNKKTELNIFFLTGSSIWESLVKYLALWPPFQWVTSLLTLILIYWASGYFYNKFLSQKGGWMDVNTRIYMILIDLILNFSLGIYYMNYRDTFIGSLMVQCPVFCSPIFWIVELLCFYMYSKYGLSLKKKNDTKT